MTQDGTAEVIPAATPEVRHNAAAQRYEIWLAGERVGLADYYERGDGAVVFPHTEVDPQHRGQGLAARMVGAALDDVRAQGRRAVPACPYVARFVRLHPEYGDLVA